MLQTLREDGGMAQHFRHPIGGARRWLLQGKSLPSYALRQPAKGQIQSSPRPPDVVPHISCASEEDDSSAWPLPAAGVDRRMAKV